MRAVIATAFLCLVAACAPVPSPSPSASSVDPAPSASAAALASASPSAAPAAWLPPWADANTPVEVTTRSALPFCGVEQGAGPGITINAEVRSCFLGGYQDGTGAEFASIMTSIEGDPIATIWRTIPGGGVETLNDATQDRFGSGGWTRTVCRQLVSDQREVFVADGCGEGVPIQ
jgi:hypothetical protein